MDFKDLSPDPVYEYFKKSVSEGYEVVGGKIEEPKIFTPSQPRKTITLRVKNKETGQTGSLVYNYNRVEREL